MKNGLKQIKSKTWQEIEKTEADLASFLYDLRENENRAFAAVRSSGSQKARNEYQKALSRLGVAQRIIADFLEIDPDELIAAYIPQF